MAAARQDQFRRRACSTGLARFDSSGSGASGLCRAVPARAPHQPVKFHIATVAWNGWPLGFVGLAITRLATTLPGARFVGIVSVNVPFALMVNWPAIMS